MHEDLKNNVIWYPLFKFNYLASGFGSMLKIDQLATILNMGWKITPVVEIV